MIGLLVASLVVTIGTVWAFERNAPDFAVFYSAWKLVLSRSGAAPRSTTSPLTGFSLRAGVCVAALAAGVAAASGGAWRSGVLPRRAVVGFVVREFQPARPVQGTIASLGMAAWGVALVARPLLIDFQYGQVNTLILGACCWALLGHFRVSVRAE